MSSDKLSEKLRQCARDSHAGNPHWVGNAKQLMEWAADALDAADAALIEQYLVENKDNKSR